MILQEESRGAHAPQKNIIIFASWLGGFLSFIDDGVTKEDKFIKQT
jgi:hypothetical protein